MSKPVIIMVTGAWHCPLHYSNITTFFESSGYTVICKQHPSIGNSDPSVDNYQDAARIRESIDSVKEDVVLIMHSYGGVAGSMAAKRAKNVIGLIFIAAFIIPVGKALSDAPPHDNSWCHINHELGIATTDIDSNIFYNDCSADDTREAMKLLQHHNVSAFFTPVRETAWTDLPKMYASTKDDKAIPLSVQDQMVEEAEKWLEVKSFDTGHSPWFSKKDELNEWLEASVIKLQNTKSK